VRQWIEEIRSGARTSDGATTVLAGIGAMDLVLQGRGSHAHAKACARKLQTERRLQWLRALLDDPLKFDTIVASGRYLKLCAMLEWASTEDEVASWRLDHLGESAPASLTRCSAL